MNKLEKRLKKTIKKSYKSEDFIKNLSLEFQKEEINLLINEELFLKYILKNIIDKNIYTKKVKEFKKALLESLFQYKKINKNKIYLESIVRETNFCYIIKRYSEIKKEKKKAEKIHDYLCNIGFEFKKSEQKESVFVAHNSVSMHIIEAIEKLIKQIESDEEKRKRIIDF